MSDNKYNCIKTIDQILSNYIKSHMILSISLKHQINRKIKMRTLKKKNIKLIHL